MPAARLARAGAERILITVLYTKNVERMEEPRPRPQVDTYSCFFACSAASLSMSKNLFFLDAAVAKR